MPRLLPTLVLAAVLAAPVTNAAADTPKPDCHGTQVTDKSGDSVNSLDPTLGAGNPSSDLTAGWFTYDAASGKATANIQVANLTAGEIDAPYDGISWEFQFSAGSNARYLRGFEDISGMTKFTWGEPRAVTDDQTTPRAGGATTGTLFPGANGVIQIDVPLKDMNVAPGTTFKALALEVRQWDTLPAATPSTPLPLYSPAPIYDTATGKSGFTVGPCITVAPPPSTPAPTTPTTPSTPAQAAKLNVKVTVPKLSAKKLAKAKKFTVKLAGNASNLTASLRAGNLGPDGKVVGTGALKALKGKGKLTIKLRGKVRKGTYTLQVSGRNADGSAAAGAVAVKVR
jgi:hypothetical protein